MGNENQNQLQIDLRPEVAEGTYANLAVITHSTCEVILDFISYLPGMQKGDVRSRIVMAPEHAKRLMFALQDNIQKYEQQFGKINLQAPSQAPDSRTVAPFAIEKGEA